MPGAAKQRRWRRLCLAVTRDVGVGCTVRERVAEESNVLAAFTSEAVLTTGDAEADESVHLGYVNASDEEDNDVGLVMSAASHVPPTVLPSKRLCCRAHGETVGHASAVAEQTDSEELAPNSDCCCLAQGQDVAAAVSIECTPPAAKRRFFADKGGGGGGDVGHSRVELTPTPLSGWRSLRAGVQVEIDLDCDDGDAEAAATSVVGHERVPADGTVAEASDAGGPFAEGYTLHDLRHVIETLLPRYKHLLSQQEQAELAAFAQLSLPAQQLYARLLPRKWPQWIRLEGLGGRYRELGSEATARAAVMELAAAQSGQEPWLLDTATETAEALLKRHLPQRPGPDDGKAGAASAGSYGTLLLQALPAPELQQLARVLGVCTTASHGGRGGRAGSSKSKLLDQVCSAARQQRTLLSHMSISSNRESPAAAADSTCSSNTSRRSVGTAVDRLVVQVLAAGRWVCVAPSPGRAALVLLGELFQLETTSRVDSSFVIFTTRWPEYTFVRDGAAPPLFFERVAFDAFVQARHAAATLSSNDRGMPGRQCASEEETQFFENALHQQLEAIVDAGGIQTSTDAYHAAEAAKLLHPFRRRFTAAWAWAQALHHAVMHPISACKGPEVRLAKVRRLQLLLRTRLCVTRRGRWHNELAKELLRTEGPIAALYAAAEGLVEGMQPLEDVAIEASIVSVDLTAECPSQESKGIDGMEQAKHHEVLPLLSLDARWDLARRCRMLAGRAAAAEGRPSKAWQRQLRECPVAQARAAITGDNGQWLPALVMRLIAEEASARQPRMQVIYASQLGVPQCREPGTSRRRLFDGFDLQQLTVEELALRHYLGTGGLTCGMHCEGSLPQELFGLLLFDELFDTSVEGAFTSAYQDAPLDLGTEAFYVSRRTALDQRLATLAMLSPSAMAMEVRACCTRLHGMRIRGMHWDRYEGPCGTLRRSDAQQNTSNNSNAVTGPSCYNSRDATSTTEPPATAAPAGQRRGVWLTGRIGTAEVPAAMRDIGAIAGSVGGRVVAAILRHMCTDYNSSGFPDLVLWTWHEEAHSEARFVEVKSENDTLSRRQELWLAVLHGAGAHAEVCHVRDD